MLAELGYETIQQELLTIKQILKITKHFTSLLSIKSWTKYRLLSKTILNGKVNEAWYITNKPKKGRFLPLQERGRTLWKHMSWGRLRYTRNEIHIVSIKELLSLSDAYLITNWIWNSNNDDDYEL